MTHADRKAITHAAGSFLTCAVSAVAFMVLALVVWVGVERAFDVIASAFKGGF